MPLSLKDGMHLRGERGLVVKGKRLSFSAVSITNGTFIAIHTTGLKEHHDRGGRKIAKAIVPGRSKAVPSARYGTLALMHHSS